MRYTGTIENGQIVFDPGITLPEGARVQVIVEETASNEAAAAQDWVDGIEKLARPRGWPADFARNLDQHLVARRA